MSPTQATYPLVSSQKVKKRDNDVFPVCFVKFIRRGKKHMAQDIGVHTACEAAVYPGVFGN